MKSLFSMLWNAADNDVGINSGPLDGAALVGGPEAEDAGNMDNDRLQSAMSQLGSGLGIGVGYGRDGGRGIHSGKGWDSKGSVTCHSYGCQVNFAHGGGAQRAATFH
eukprot:CAMPEP_0181318202 /NCGR_PEP_ID=MMETSP1101-20121128/16883_1 /TAXON_ID=46948 /ORGANISM="Rhodomonas abbreviata, Strain Caron Lab Isolate" /LENGTH=106 /DNA_ID=CAMNT_0023425661 /DNA_START=18 /DNA_END=338 /DNA_ORIENTATION=+